MTEYVAQDFELKCCSNKYSTVSRYFQIDTNAFTTDFIKNYAIRECDVIKRIYLHRSLSTSLSRIEPSSGNCTYRNDPKFSDRQVWVNSADSDQTADQSIHCLPFRLHRLDSLLYGRAT